VITGSFLVLAAYALPVPETEGADLKRVWVAQAAVAGRNVPSGAEAVAIMAQQTARWWAGETGGCHRVESDGDLGDPL